MLLILVHIIPGDRGREGVSPRRSPRFCPPAAGLRLRQPPPSPRRPLLFPFHPATPTEVVVFPRRADAATAPGPTRSAASCADSTADAATSPHGPPPPGGTATAAAPSD